MYRNLNIHGLFHMSYRSHYLNNVSYLELVQEFLLVSFLSIPLFDWHYQVSATVGQSYVASTLLVQDKISSVLAF